MPKVYMTIEERKRADDEIRNRKTDKLLIMDLREAKKGLGFDYDEVARRAGVGRQTVCKAFNEPGKMRIDLLRKICFAVGVKLEISAEGG